MFRVRVSRTVLSLSGVARERSGETRMKKCMVLAVVAAMTLCGCATVFYDSAPADKGHIYVVGGKIELFRGWQPTVWRCPAKSSGECREVSVSE